MTTEINLSRTSGLVTLGTHTFQVTERSSENMGDSGYPYWRLICQVISAGDDQGKEVMHQISHAPQSRFIVDEFLDGIGAPTKGKWTLPQCINKKFRASVEHEMYNGKLKTAFASVMPAADVQGSFDTLKSEVDEVDEALPDDTVPDEGEGESEEQPRKRGSFG